MKCIGYVVRSTDSYVMVVFPEKPFGKLKCRLLQRDGKKTDADAYDKYELYGFDLEVDQEGNVKDWKIINVEKLVEIRHFVALLADRRIIADDGKAYKIWDHKELKSDNWVSQFDWAFSNSDFNSIRNIRLFIRNGIIYGTDISEDYKFRDSWSIEDALIKYLSQYDRYKISNFGAMSDEQRNPLLAAAQTTGS